MPSGLSGARVGVGILRGGIPFMFLEDIWSVSQNSHSILFSTDIDFISKICGFYRTDLRDLSVPAPSNIVNILSSQYLEIYR